MSPLTPPILSSHSVTQIQFPRPTAVALLCVMSRCLKGRGCVTGEIMTQNKIWIQKQGHGVLLPTSRVPLEGQAPQQKEVSPAETLKFCLRWQTHLWMWITEGNWEIEPATASKVEAEQFSQKNKRVLGFFWTMFQYINTLSLHLMNYHNNQ